MGDRKLSDSYRPISLVPVFSKISEVLIYKQLRGFLLCVIYPKQFRFCVFIMRNRTHIDLMVLSVPSKLSPVCYHSYVLSAQSFSERAILKN